MRSNKTKNYSQTARTKLSREIWFPLSLGNFLPMNIAVNKVVSVTYSLEMSEGGSSPRVFVERAEADEPLTFLFGTGSMIPGFEKALEGLGSGDAFRMDIQPEEAYGPVSEDDIVELPYSVFAEEAEKHPDMLSIGNIIPMNDGQGNQFQGTVKSVGSDTVTMDFNHPLAGKTLHFSGKIESLRDASADEIAHGHVHGPGGHHH
jgi:FKBP-type peptidyl-prolyl cis-trans isomerase SlyD